MENTKEQKRETLHSVLGMTEKRGMNLHEMCFNLLKSGHFETTISAINEARKITENANEDIYVCYIIGVMQGREIGKRETIDKIVSGVIFNHLGI